MVNKGENIYRYIISAQINIKNVVFPFMYGFFLESRLFILSSCRRDTP